MTIIVHLRKNSRSLSFPGLDLSIRIAKGTYLLTKHHQNQSTFLLSNFFFSSPFFLFPFFLFRIFFIFIIFFFFSFYSSFSFSYFLSFNCYSLSRNPSFSWLTRPWPSRLCLSQMVAACYSWTTM